MAWWDSDYSGGVPDLSTSPSPVNLIAGSNAVMTIGLGGVGQITYRATGWRGKLVQSCWHLDRKSFRATGSDIVNAANGLGKTWEKYTVMVPRITSVNSAGSVSYGSGWDRIGAAAFTAACGITRTQNNRFTWGVYTNSSEVIPIDSPFVNQNAQIVGVSRVTSTQVQIGVNNVWTAAATWGSGTTYNVDGYSIGGWAGNNTGNPGGDQYVRAEMVFNRPLTTPERDELHAYLVSIYSGFENIATLGGSAVETLVFLSIGQSNEVGNPTDGVINTYSGLSDVWVVGFDGITRPFAEPAYDGTLYATGAINHTSPDTPGQSSLGAMAARLRALGVTSRILFAPAARGSTSAVNWNTGHADSPPTYQNIYGGARHALHEAMRAPNAIIAGVLFNQGEVEAQADAITAAAWTGNWDTTCTDLLAYASAQGWTWKKTKRFFLAKLQNASSLAFKDDVRVAQDLLGSTRADVVVTQEPDAAPANIHLQAQKQIDLGVLRANDWFSAS